MDVSLVFYSGIAVIRRSVETGILKNSTIPVYLLLVGKYVERG